MLFLSCEFIGTTQNFRNGTLIFHKRKLIGILNSSSYTRKGQRVEFWARSGWGPGLPGGGLWEEPGWGGRQQGEACSHKASPPIGQTGGSLAGPANLPNYRAPGCWPGPRGAILTPHREGQASQKGPPPNR